MLSYWRAIATRKGSGVIRWSWSSSPASSWTQLIVPVNSCPPRCSRRSPACPCRTEVARLVAGIDHRNRRVDAAFADISAVDVERDGAALPKAATVVGELHPHLMGAGRHRRRRPRR